MNKKLLPVFLLLVGLFPVSVFTQTAPQTHVYVAGYFMDGTVQKPCYWVDGERKELPIESGDSMSTIHNVIARAITVVDGVVYVAGRCVVEKKPYLGASYTDTSLNSCYWRNEILYLLPSPSVRWDCYANDISVINGKVHVVGERRYRSGEAKPTNIYWIDGKINKDSDDSPIVGIDNEDGISYLIHYLENRGAGGSGSYSAYGQRIGLKQPDNSNYSNSATIPTDISVENGNVFISGNWVKYKEPSRPYYWLNSEPNILPILQAHNNAKNVSYYTAGIVAKDGKVYIAGFYVVDDNNAETVNIRQGCYWVDNELRELKENGVTITGIAVSGGKVYLSGTYRQGDIVRACYWIDGERKNLPTGRSADDIFVVTN